MWVVLSSKGGVGKSTIAKNLLIPYVVQKYNRAFYINTNDTNDEEKLVRAKNFSVEAVRIAPEEIKKLELSPYTVLDAGAGKNTIEVLKALSEIQRDVVIVIALSKRLTEINEAIKTYKFARKFGFRNIALVLNRVWNLNNPEQEFPTLFSPLSNDIPLIDYFCEAKKKLLLFPFDEKDILGIIEDLENRLPYDFYLEADNFIHQYRKKMMKGILTEKDKAKRKSYGFLQDIFEEILAERNLNILKEFEKRLIQKL